MRRRVRTWIALAVAIDAASPSLAEEQPTSLARPSGDPLAVDIGQDPILQLSRRHGSAADFRRAVAAAVAGHPGTAEFEAMRAEAEAVRAEARERRLPSIDINLSSYQVIAREFSNDPNNILERSRPAARTDAIIAVQQNLFDFGAADRRVAAAGARLRAAAAEAEAAADRVALAAIASWYDVFAYRTVVDITDGFITSQQELRDAVEQRIEQGVSARGDTARVESYIASAQTRLARFRRLAAAAEARFTELTRSPPPADLQRAPVAELPQLTRDAASNAAAARPEAKAAEALAQAARHEAKAVRADRLPQVSAGIDGGRYGVFETDRDYDIRGRVTVRHRLFGGSNARVTQAEARVRQAEARAIRIREEGSRDAAIAWSDVQALEAQLVALERSYLATRRSRDVLLERFIHSRGDLFDVVAADDAYYETAVGYIQALSELDAARYVLLSRMGRLLETLGIELENAARRG